MAALAITSSSPSSIKFPFRHGAAMKQSMILAEQRFVWGNLEKGKGNQKDFYAQNPMKSLLWKPEAVILRIPRGAMFELQHTQLRSV